MNPTATLELRFGRIGYLGIRPQDSRHQLDEVGKYINKHPVFNARVGTQPPQSGLWGLGRAPRKTRISSLKLASIWTTTLLELARNLRKADSGGLGARNRHQLVN
ncbi:hypothetical protein TRICI_001402 [Trichomonascus ciferrii]|uniref:Uncharacterized protein n=1 Tax=Trichomonascus ciferrii TaxID=44093 RepID=A0A642VA08_9ASCO|nr:hypothetical protein TRICI_001402 [Trichomonascus ciferrii]